MKVKPLDPCTEMNADALRRRLARYFGRVPYLSAVAIGTSLDYPKQPVLVILLSRDLLEIPDADLDAGMDDVQRSCRRVARLLGIYALRTAMDVHVLRGAETIFRATRSVVVAADVSGCVVRAVCSPIRVPCTVETVDDGNPDAPLYVATPDVGGLRERAIKRKPDDLGLDDPKMGLLT